MLREQPCESGQDLAPFFEADFSAVGTVAERRAGIGVRREEKQPGKGQDGKGASVHGVLQSEAGGHPSSRRAFYQCDGETPGSHDACRNRANERPSRTASDRVEIRFDVCEEISSKRVRFTDFPQIADRLDSEAPAASRLALIERN